MRRPLAAMLLVLAAGCASRTPAPVTDRLPLPETAPPPAVQAPAEPLPVEKPLPTHTVKRGETLVSIALQYGLDYRELAAWNHIVNPNALKVGQVLVVAAPPGARPPPGPVTMPLAIAGPPIEGRPLGNSATTKVEPRAQKVPFSERALAELGSPDAPASAPGAPAAAAGIAPPAPAPAEADKASGTDREDIDWTWPAKGKVLAAFSESSKGVDIAGRKGAPVVAAASGKVIYAGEGVRGYGKLVIIKHNNVWLSAYAHNDKLLVEERQDVKKGQRIAQMGSTDAEQVKLHFEVRRLGKPVDPARILPAM